MIDFDKAYDIVMSHTRSFGVEEVELLKSVGRVLQEDLIAERDLPPFDRVMMDGIAIKYSAANNTNHHYLIEAIGGAGSPQLTLKDDQNCIEIMTGAILPKGSDTVVRYEDLIIADGKAQIQTTIRASQNVHTKGKDRNAGATLLKQGKTIGSEDIGTAATVGKSTIKVSRLPRTLIISTGDELVEVHESPLPHQIRKSNVYQIAASLQSVNVSADLMHLLDDEQGIEDEIRAKIKEYDLIILSGGVSKGKFDFVPKVLEKIGVEKLFHKVKQRPGKPFWFGIHPEGCTVFALPGNPVSSYMCTHVYLMSWIKRSIGANTDETYHAVLAEDVHFKPDLTYFLEVKLDIDKSGVLNALPMKGNGSGDLSNMTRAQAFIKLSPGKESYKKGEVYPIYLFSQL